ncbi:L,D-transpeptidase Cds6 family protein [Pigmentibacter ruber]|uniref:L,D-transpeptidase family protein n=1 Tax=Pigmentibacter ruber TaxID=2683196 RepID=UPI00131A95F4|nr:L,D-transpeptidase family protein [Pigmentibacter ruber]BFD32104.1 hypothetical protein GTC16762_17220 [Pigmentibacter ruber]
MKRLSQGIKFKDYKFLSVVYALILFIAVFSSETLYSQETKDFFTKESKELFQKQSQTKSEVSSNLVLNHIPSAFVSLGAYLPIHAIVVEKNLHKLSVFKMLLNGNYTLVKTYLAITGKEQGDKKFRGDNRTPEGIYFIVGQKDGADLIQKWGPSARKYGPKAFVLDYPNIFDKRQRKTGSGIWIHGVDKDDRMQRPFDTEGCVALRNEDVLDISQYISEYQTPVVIVDKMSVVPHEDLLKERARVSEMIESWRTSWESSDFETYLSFYSPQFQSLGKNKEGWYEYKEKLAKLRAGEIKVEISQPKILAFRNQLLVEFTQRYSSPDKKDFGRKYLYLRKEGNIYKIIAEKWYAIPKGKSELAVTSESSPKKRSD